MNKKEGTPVKTINNNSDMPDAERIAKEKKKQAVLAKARSKFLDAIRSKNIDKDKDKKSRTQTTIDYILKPCPGTPPRHDIKNQVITNNQTQQPQQNGHTTLKRAASLQKQHSVGSYPIAGSEEEMVNGIGCISRLRPATVCIDKINDEARQTAALALERPRKKLSFREPEIMGYPIQINKDAFPRKGGRKAFTPEMKRNINNNFNNIRKIPSFDLEDLDLESQAMRIVRTVGQAFEVCHKLSINAPETDPLDYDEQETLTQDLVSDRLSDVPSEKPKKDFNSEGASDKLSLPDENCIKDINGTENNTNNPTNNTNSNPNSNKARNNRTYHLDLLTIPSGNISGGNTTNSSNSHSPSRKSPMNIAETYTSQHLDGLGGSGSCSSSIPISGSAISAHHEIQLLREQLDQQSQQTQAALAQLQLAREQLAAEQSARLEAQARTHQLLIHNRELLDHIAALVAHLQGGEKSGSQQQNAPHVAMPQLSSAAKVERWFELIEPMSISRPESGFISYQDQDAEDDEERAIIEGTKSLLSKLSARKQRKLLGYKLGKVTTF